MNYYMNSLNNSYLAVHTDTLCANVAAIEKTLSPGAEIIPVLKCDAYGLSLSLSFSLHLSSHYSSLSLLSSLFDHELSHPT